jgi:hypothetical protein
MKFQKFHQKLWLCAALVIAPCGFAMPGQADETPKASALSVLPYETLGIGNESGATTRALFAINDETEWKRVWGVHTKVMNDAPSLPKVDFARQSVIAVLSGERSDGKSLQIAQIVRAPRETIVYFWLTDDAWRDTLTDKNAPAQPYLFVAIDKSDAPLRFVDALRDTSCTKCAG